MDNRLRKPIFRTSLGPERVVLRILVDECEEPMRERSEVMHPALVGFVVVHMY